ncbi:MAG: globin domain-containing protein [Ferruginibacter sp.]
MQKMNEAEIILIKRSWSIFRSIDPLLVGDVFYSRLFFKMPALRKMFSASMNVQYKKLVDMLSVIVARLDRLDEITVEIKELAIRHVGYAVKPLHYEVVGDALLWTLEQGLGSDWNEEVKAAWAACYGILSNAMIDAAGYDK